MMTISWQFSSASSWFRIGEVGEITVSCWEEIIRAAGEFVQVEEEDGEDHTEEEEEERDSEGNQVSKSKVVPDRPWKISDWTDCKVHPSKLLTEDNSGLLSTAANLDPGECEEGDSGKDDEGGMSGQDIERGFTAELQCRHHGEQKLWTE